MEFEKLARIIAETLDINESQITEDSAFVDDLGADSLDVAEIIMALEDEFDIAIDENDIENIRTVGNAVELIKQAVQ